jgi:hypothetical protein
MNETQKFHLKKDSKYLKSREYLIVEVIQKFTGSLISCIDLETKDRKYC